MTDCDDFRIALMDIGRGVLAGSPAAQHAENCPACRRWLANETALSAGLAALSQHDAGVPLHVKAALLAAFRERPVKPARRAFPRWAIAAGIAAAAVWLIFAISTRSRKTAIPNPVIARVQPPAAITPAVTPPVAKLASAKKGLRPRRLRATAVTPKVEDVPEIATDFYQIPYTEPLRPEQRADVFRVSMPRASMAVFGLPVTGGQLDGHILADVMVGEDGVARAVRFVR